MTDDKNINTTLSPSAQHAYGFISVALCNNNCDLTNKEIREIIKKVYGDDVDKELQKFALKNKK